MRSIVTAWNRFWFTPQPATDIAICRVLFFGLMLAWRWATDFGRWGELGASFWYPVGVFRYLHLPLLDTTTLRALGALWLVALAMGCIGWMTRVSTVVAAVLGVYLIGLPHNFGKIHHSDAATVFVLIGFALSRCGDHLSVDAWQRRRKGMPSPLPSGEYRWPIRVAWLICVLLYSAAGVSKIRNSGAAWVLSDSFHNLLLEHHYTHRPMLSWGLVLAEYPIVCRLLAAGTIFIETLCPLALLSPLLRMVFIPTLAAMQIGIWLLLGVRFDWYVLLFLFWVPWTALGSALSLAGSSSTAPAFGPRVERRDANE